MRATQDALAQLAASLNGANGKKGRWMAWGDGGSLFTAGASDPR